MTSSNHNLGPLADRVRPRSLDEFFGQSHLLDPGKPLRHALEGGILHSMILWGPPGTGKTTLARLLTRRADAEFLNLSAVLAGVKDVRNAIETARQIRAERDKATVLFIDEVHRFNKAQQDAFLPHVEEGIVTFIGATTENPSFELNNALLSRAKVYVLRPLDQTTIRQVIDRALVDASGLGGADIEMSPALRDEIAAAADGDARRALNFLEIVADLTAAEHRQVVHEETVRAALSGSLRRFDKGGDAFYDQISALHKSVRGSAPDAALYWFTRMIDGGCDPVYIARRLVRMASEDIGNADPRALRLALDAWETYDRLGTPEGELALAQAVIYLACAAKSNAVYKAYNSARDDVAKFGSAEVPVHLRNAPTKLMRELGHGRRYRYAHDEPDAYAAGENYFPEGVASQRYYHPAPRGLEQRIAEKLEYLRQLDRAKKK